MEPTDNIVLREISTVLENISNAVNANRSSFFLLDQESNTLQTLAAQGLTDAIISIPMGKGVAGHVAATGEAMIINDAQRHPLLSRSHGKSLGFVTRMLLCVPVFDDQGKVLGVIQALNKKKGLFDENDRIILSSLAATVSLIIKNAQLYETAKRGREDISTLLEVSSAISSELELDNLIQLIMNKASGIVEADRSSLFLVDEEKNELWTKFAKGLEDAEIRIPISKGIVGMVAESKEPYIVNDAYQNPFFDATSDQKTGYTTKSILSVPVLNANKKLLGVIQVINKKEGEFSIQDLWILNGFAAQTSIAIENAKLFDEINRMKNYLDDLIQNLSSGIITVDKKGTIKTVNKSFCKMIGIKPEDFLGKHYQKLEEKYAPIFQSNEKVIQTGRKYEEYDISAPLQNNKRLIFNLNALPMQDINGGNIGAVSVLDDITQEKRVRENLSRYLPQHLVKEVMNKDDLSLLNGRAQKCSILFSDIRSFTSLTEQLGANEIVAMLNEYFHSMVDCIFQSNGLLDKFIGDAIMAVFGIPYVNSKDPINAIHAALNMYSNLDILNTKRIGEDKLPLRMGIGISTGQVVSGNIGSEKRFEYTVIGDPVNLASRLEGATKKYGVNILICETTYADATAHFFCREVDTIRVKGKKTPTKIYSVLDARKNALTKDTSEFLETYFAALEHYRNRGFEQAYAAFQYAQSLNTEDIPTQLFLNRCEHFMDTPPPQDWDGVWHMEEK